MKKRKKEEKKKKDKMNKAIYYIITAYLIVTSCDPNRLYEQNLNIPKDKWEQLNLIEFRPEIKDTVSPDHIYINIRNTGEYPFSNLFLFVTTYSPLGYSIKDTFECTLADEKGKWLGKGFGNIWSNQILYKKYVKFPFPGTYTFEYQQAMRTEELPGIIDVGLRIEKVNLK